MSEKGITPAQLPTDAKSNEITAIPKVLLLIDVRRAIITLDAMGAQTSIVKEIVDRKGDVIMCLKGNQGKLYNSVADFIERHTDTAAKKRHGRLESGTYIHLHIPKDFPLDEKWVGIKSIGVVVRETNSAGKHTTERSFYISSLPVRASRTVVTAQAVSGQEQRGWKASAVRMERRAPDASPCPDWD
jgi:predicted transposase YbfD/YdcC